MIDLLADPIPDVRITAVRCLVALVPHQTYLLLRLMVTLGDKSAPVLEECFTALLQTDPRKSMPFVAGFLDSGDEDARTSAAIALGESRRQEAFDALVARWQREHDADFRATLLHAVAMLRQEHATRFLLSLLAKEGTDAVDALLALAPYRAVDSIRQEVEATVTRTQAKDLIELFKRKFRT